MRADERRVRVAITVAGEGDQFALGQRSSHHPSYTAVPKGFPRPRRPGDSRVGQPTDGVAET